MRRKLAQGLFRGGQSFSGSWGSGSWNSGRRTSVGSPIISGSTARGHRSTGSVGLVTQLGDEGVGFVPSELPARLPLGEPHRTPCVTKVLMPGFNKKFQEFPNLVM